jgi:dihydroorotate dehydrogenase
LFRLIEGIAQQVLHLMDPEDAHRLAVKGLQLVPRPPCGLDDKRLAVSAFGLSFPNPVGIAAGFDKNAEAANGALAAGCGFAEIGTVTPRPQSGNPRPRLFRLTADTAVINRMGFNNDGHAAVHARLTRSPLRGIVGVNVGANKDAEDRIADYVAGIRAFADVASYFTVNVSSPNTPGLRDLQQKGVLDDLLARVLEARDAAATRRPVLLKIAPDLALGDLDDIVAVARARAIDGMIVSNTTITRPATLREAAKSKEAGGLSGAPLFALSTRMLAETFVRVESAFPLIGVGGIASGADAVAKVKAGASLLQVYSALVFRGLGLIGDMKSALTAEIAREKAESLAPLVGRDAAALTREVMPG